jgi:Protein of unknown function (DUF3551)
MNKVHSAAATLAMLSLSIIGQRPAVAEIYRPWCVGYTATISLSCTFVSFEQCMETARGGGGSCMQNPWYLQYGERAPTPDATYRSRRARRR